jgi:hypothetical protein
MENRRVLLIIGAIAALMLACVACFALTGAGAYIFARELGENIDLGGIELDSNGSSEPTAEVVRGEELPSTETLDVLQNAIVPENNPVDLAERLLGLGDIPDSVPGPSSPLQVGDRRNFWVIDSSIDRTFETEAVLRYVGDTIYFWVEDGVSFNQGELDDLASTFEDEIVPLTRNFFGSEWSPGIDNDTHIYILYSTNVGGRTAAYFAPGNSVHPLANEFSNAAEMFVVNADNSPLADPYTYGALAHEFQHMIHSYRDGNESSWLNEGLSELATLLNDYVHTGFGYLYTERPDLQLNDWPTDPDATRPHYGAGFLFSTYFLERFGNEATQALVGHSANGLDSVDAVFRELGLQDPKTGELFDADQLVLEWVTANYLMDGSVADGRFHYPNYSFILSPPQPTEWVSDCNVGAIPRDVHQYGVDYIRIECAQDATLSFEGSTQTALLPADPYSGSYAFWTNKGDESDMRLTQTFDFSEVTEPISLSFRTWFDIELDWDYVYVLVSTDDGASWDFQETPSGTNTDPNGNNYGWGLTGYSGGAEDEGIWIEEVVDLSAYAGQEVLLRFEYITDAAVNGEGLLLDDIRIDAIGYFNDFESDSGGWQAEGFARIENILLQKFKLALISHGSQTSVQYLELDTSNSLEIDLDFDGGTDEYTLVIMGATRFTRQSAGYRVIFSSP